MKPNSYLTLCLLLAPLTLGAQISDVILGRPSPLPRQLGEFLMLTPAQLTNFTQHQQDSQTALQSLLEQTAEARTMLAEALKADSPDATTIGTLLVRITRLQRQAAEQRSAQIENLPTALALTMAQREKLTELRQALELQPIVFAALNLGLIPPTHRTVENPGELVPLPLPFPLPPTNTTAPPTNLIPAARPAGLENTTTAATEALLHTLSTASSETAENVRRIADRLSVVPVQTVPRP